MRKLSFAFVLSLLLIPALVSTAWAQTADEIVDKYLAAIGGRAALEKLTSRRATGSVMISTPNGDISGSIEIFNKAPNKSRMAMQLDLSAMGMTDPMFAGQTFDGTVAWLLNSLQGDTEITGNQLENMRNSVFPTPLLTYKAAGTTLEVLPKEEAGGRAMIVLRATPKAGSATRLFFDAETYLLVRTVATVNSPQMGGDVEQTGEFSDYRVDGVKVAFQILNSIGQQSASITITTVEHNVPLDDAMFSVKAPV